MVPMDPETSDDESESVEEDIVEGIEDKLAENPFDFDSHLSLLFSLREEAKLEKLRQARKRASLLIALPEEEWLAWIDDEKTLAGDEDFGRLVSLHREACKAQPLSSKVWLRLCNLIRSKPDRQVREVRAAFEEALSALGLHAVLGPEIWGAYREFEHELLKEAEEEDKSGHVQQVRRLFLRQLAVPQMGGEQILQALTDWEKTLSMELKKDLVEAKRVAAETAKVWKEHKDLEQRLVESDRPSPMVSHGTTGGSAEVLFDELLALEEASGDPARVILALARAAQKLPGDAQRWLLYADRVTGSDALNVMERAVRNNPTCRDLWIRLLQEHERLESPDAELVKVRERAMTALSCPTPEGQETSTTSSAALELLLGHVDACRRRASESKVKGDARWKEMRASFEHAVSVMQTEYADSGLALQILLQWVRTEAHVVSNGPATLKLVDRLAESPWGPYYNVWQAAIGAARSVVHEIEDVRNLYKRAAQQVVDYPDQAKNDFVQFERECGSLESWLEAKQWSQTVAQDPSLPESSSAQAEAPAEETTKGAKKKKKRGQAKEQAQEQKPKDISPTATVATSEQSRTSDAAPQPEETNDGGSAQATSNTSVGIMTGQLDLSNVSFMSFDAELPAGDNDLDGTEPVQTQKVVGPSPSKDPCVAPSGLAGPSVGPSVDPSVGPSLGPSAGPSAGPSVGPAAGPSLGPSLGPTTETKSSASEFAELQKTMRGQVAKSKTAPASSQEASSGTNDEAPKTSGDTPVDAATVNTVSTGDDSTTKRQELEDNSSTRVTGKTAKKKRKLAKAKAAVGEDAPVEEPAEVPVEGTTVEKPSEAPMEDAQAEEPQGDAENEDETENIHKGHRGSHYLQKKALDGKAAPPPEKEGEQTVHVANLDWTVTEGQLSELFEQIPGFIEVRLVKDFLGRSKGFAYVDYDNGEHVGAAVTKFDGHEVNKRAMKVARSLPTQQLYEDRKVFVVNIHEDATDIDVKEFFMAQVGEVVGVTLHLDFEKQAHKGRGVVEFAADESVEKALALKTPKLKDQVLDISRCIPMKSHRHQKAAPRKDLPARVNQKAILQRKTESEDMALQAAKYPTTLYVKNIHLKVDEDALKKHFEQCGQVVQVLVCKNNKGQSRGFGFVEYADPNAAQAALSLSESKLMGREVIVSRSSRAICVKGEKQGSNEEVEGKGKQAAKGKGKSKEDGKGKGKPKGKGKDLEEGKGKPKGKGKDSEEGSSKPKRKGKDAEDGKDKEKAADDEQPPAKRVKTSNADEAAQHDANESKEEETKPKSNADFRKFLLA